MMLLHFAGREQEAFVSLGAAAQLSVLGILVAQIITEKSEKGNPPLGVLAPSIEAVGSPTPVRLADFRVWRQKLPDQGVESLFRSAHYWPIRDGHPHRKTEIGGDRIPLPGKLVRLQLAGPLLPDRIGGLFEPNVSQLVDDSSAYRCSYPAPTITSAPRAVKATASSTAHPSFLRPRLVSPVRELTL